MRKNGSWKTIVACVRCSLILFAVYIILSAGSMESYAASSGTCGENLTWVLDDEGTLTISGTGEMYNEEWWNYGWAPWIDKEIRKVVIEEGITNIEMYAFNACDMEQIIIPDSVTDIGVGSFFHCENLENISIPSSVEEIGDDAFEGCTNLKKINVDANNKNYFSIDGVLFGRENSSLIKFPAKKEMLTYTIPEDICCIEEDAFKGSMLKEIYIPSSVVQIGLGYVTFSKTNLQKIVVDKNNPSYFAVDGVLYGKDSETNQITLLWYPSAKMDSSYEVLEGCTAIDTKAIDSCEALESITIPESVTYIGSNFDNAGNSITIYYCGSEEQWNKIELEEVDNWNGLEDETIYFNDVSRYEVVFYLNDGTGRILTSQMVERGGCAQEPEAPSREGYLFGGWYSNKKCTGFKWFNYFNSMQGYQITGDVSLYAEWHKAQSIMYEYDTFSFENSKSDFFGVLDSLFSSCNSRLTGDYYDILMEGRTKAEQARLKEAMNAQWGGSCFGMSAVLSLVRANKLDTEFFQGNAFNLYWMDKPKDNLAVWNLINYYQLMQNTSTTSSALYKLNGEVANNKALIEALKESKYPVVVAFCIFKNGVKAGAHAVVAYACTDSKDEYRVSIWDPNDKDKTNLLIIDKDTWMSEFEEKYDTETQSTQIMSALTVESLAYDYKNLQDAIINKGMQGGADAIALSNEDNEIINLALQTNYGSFDISCSDGTKASIRNGNKVSGNAEISDAIVLNEIGTESIYQFSITNGTMMEYSVVPSEETAEENKIYQTAFYNDDVEKGFFYQIKAGAAGKICLGENGVRTIYENETVQDILSSKNANETTWDAATVEAKSTGLTISHHLTEVNILSENDTVATVRAENTYNEVLFENVQLSTEHIVSLTDNSGIVVCGKEEEELGTSLIFYSLGGTPIEAQTNILKGGTAVKPEDPIRSGFIFAGWYETPNCEEGTEWDFETPMYVTTRIYAKWDLDDNYTHTILFQADDIAESVVVCDGASLDENQIPDVPKKIDYVGKWSQSDFTNIHEDMVVYAEYSKITNPFVDVSEGSFYYTPVLWAVEEGITNGMDATHFRPADSCTRAQVVTFLWRASGSPEPTSTKNPFVDVSSERFYYKAVLWAVEKGITNGMDETHFQPDSPCTRGQVVTFLWRADGTPASSGGTVFSDVKTNSFYTKAVYWAVENGITNGIGNNLFAPDKICNRGEIVTFLYRTMN